MKAGFKTLRNHHVYVKGAMNVKKAKKMCKDRDLPLIKANRVPGSH